MAARKTELNMSILTAINSFSRRFSPINRSEISIFWHRSINFGDVLSKYIGEKLSKKHTTIPSNPEKEYHYMVTGSLLSLTTSKSILWGVGIASLKDEIRSLPHAVPMVRGKYSKQLLEKYGIDGPITLGDPGYIMSRLYAPQHVRKSYKLGVIPHWVDYDLACHIFSENRDIKVINLLNENIEEVIDDILSCMKCISSSLHGLIVSHSYGIPCLHVEFTDSILRTGLKKYNIQGDGIKFLDYFSSVDIQEYRPHIIDKVRPLDSLYQEIPSDIGNLAQIEHILSSCPFKT
jgi:hypothetical protein